MVKMPWSRNRSTSGARVPAEVEEYYQSTRRERRGIAWLLGLATLLLTLAIAVALFFGGRWLYRTLTNNNDEPQTTSQGTDQNSNPQGSEGDNQADGNGGNQDSTNNDQAQPTPAPEQNSQPSPSPTPSTPPPSNSNSTPSTGPAPEIPRTGPTE